MSLTGDRKSLLRFQPVYDKEDRKPFLTVEVPPNKEKIAKIAKTNRHKKSEESENMSKPITRSEEVRQMLPVEKLEELLKTKSRKEVCQEYNLKSYELANAMTYYQRNNGFVPPEAVKPPKTEKETLVGVPSGEVETVMPEPNEQKQTPSKPMEQSDFELEHICQCNDDMLVEEIRQLQDTVSRLQMNLYKVQEFTYSHRHQVGAGHYSETGTAK